MDRIACLSAKSSQRTVSHYAYVKIEKQLEETPKIMKPDSKNRPTDVPVTQTRCCFKSVICKIPTCAGSILIASYNNTITVIVSRYSKFFRRTEEIGESYSEGG
ncbi:hypothetical protein ElyMa_000015800 [Elysia marginata]|uniref:Uncharacterized protein n=1 Tax=Elysia marginata TaxID=1093978 RepID=A0AAV4EBA2_9GAST|nr:hypothetical protein ElyMa_000015800 [Elysia marginata]